MNRKVIIICTIVALVLLTGVGILFFSLFKGGEPEPGTRTAVSDGVSAIPSDAIFLFETGKFSTLADMTDRGSALDGFFQCLPEGSSEWKALVSLHYSSKNKVSPLFVLEIPAGADIENFRMEVTSGCRNVIHKKYGQNTIYRSTVPDIAYALYGGFLIASPSIIIVESSLRHLSGENSLKDEPLYMQSALPMDDARMDINNVNLGKLFSGMARGKYLRFAGFAQDFADWTALSIHKEEGMLHCDGTFLCRRGPENFANVLRSQKGKKSQVFSLIPFNAEYVLTLPLTSSELYLSSYRSYLEAVKKIKDYDYVNAITSRDHPSGKKTFEFVKEIVPEEIAVFSLEKKDGISRKILALRCGMPENLKMQPDTLVNYPYAGFLGAVFGKVFEPSAENACFLHDGWLMVGDRTDLEPLRDSYSELLYFSLEEYLSQTPAKDEIRNPSSLIYAVNTAKYSDTLMTMLKGPYAERMSALVGKKNFEFSFLGMHKVADRLDMDLTLYAEDLEILPQPAALKKLDTSSPASAAVDDVPVEVPEGPFQIVNFKDGSPNYLEQLENLGLRLLNRSKRPVWTIKFGGKLCGRVAQIDYLKNDKLQMLFASGNKVYLYDRLGRKVGKFPLVLQKEVLLGPDVYDFSGDKNYTMVFLHTDNTIAMYDLNGKKVSWWNDIYSSEKIRQLPELLQLEDNLCWIVRTSYQTLIYNDKGMPVADFSKKKRLSRDTEVTPISSVEVAVRTADGRDMLLNVRTGSLKRR